MHEPEVPVTLKLKVLETLAALAVSSAIRSVVTEATVAVKVFVVAPADTVTLVGTVTSVLPLVRLTAKPPVGAPSVKLTVQVELPGAATVAGLQLSPLNCAAGDTVTVVVFAGLALAVTVTVCELETEAAVAVKVAVVIPEATVTLPGTGSAALLLDRFTTSPLPVAAFVSVTVQVVVCPDVTLGGVHATVDICAGAETLSVKVLETPAALAVNNAV